MSSYAIASISGKQVWVEENKFYDFDFMALNPGTKFKLNQILLMQKENVVGVGKPFLSPPYHIEAIVLRHVAGPKFQVYKMRPKKKTRKTFGNRCKRTRIIITSIKD